MSHRILHYRSPKHHYKAEVCIVWCFDHRFKEILEKYLKHKKIRYPDEVKGAGGAKALASDKNKNQKKYIFDQIKTSIRLHHTPKIILMTHSDCGGYGGLRAFKNDPKKEMQKHGADLKKAKSFLKEKLSGSIQIETLFADFNGLWRM